MAERVSWWSRALVLAGTVVLAVDGSAQRPAGRSVVETVQVNVVNVEVYVTGADGNPLRGLRREDFELEEDGEPVDITNFYASDAVMAVSAGTLPGEAPVVPPTAAPAPVPVPDEQVLTVVFFIDALNTPMNGRKVVLDQLQRLIESDLGTNSRMLVLSFDRSLKQLSPLTTDRRAILEALGSVGREAPTASALNSERQFLLRRLFTQSDRPVGGVNSPCREWQGGADEGPPEVCSAITAHAEQLLQLNRALIRGLGRALDALSGVAGRKALVLVSAGIPPRPGEDLLFISYGPAGPSSTLTPELDEIAARANSGRITFYTVNPRGDQLASPLDASDELSTIATDGALKQTLITANQMDLGSRQEALTDLAVATGGRTLLAGPGLGNALGQVEQEFGAYYSLGFSPDHSGDGTYHDLKVRLRVRGARIRHREGYLDKTDAQRLADRAAGALLGETRPNGLRVKATTGEPVKKGSKFLVPLTVTVAAADLLLLPSADGTAQEGRVALIISATDRGGQISDAHNEQFPIHVPAAVAEAFKRGETTYSFELLMRKGTHKVAVIARDELALTDGSLTFDVTVP
ncbi:MAG TPA: VWA domain-containing protein [Thermoanaerobaculaceae bacterium]|nr:VWA domain-containing protein [Thermoanaerobaculaceae bacterium]HPS77960.1 VWA domain-containing protein [Thermoanaerobaculaceae bacterium]